MLPYMILKTSYLTSSLLKNLLKIEILDLKLLRKPIRPLIINVSAKQYYWINIFKPTSLKFEASNFLVITELFMLNI